MEKVIKSFQDALAGIAYCIETQRNFRVHMLLSLLVCFLSIAFKVSWQDNMFLLSAIFFVLVTEVTNTAIERAVDLASKKEHPIAHIAKDVAAGAVLLSAIYATLIGLIIFIPYMLVLIQQ